MLKGQVFDEQIFESECFAHFINIFLNKKNGITKGCNLTKTNNSVTINSGCFCVQGRFLKVVGSNTVEVTPKAEYCKLICEIDLNKINTETEFKQADIKVLSSTNSYPSLTQQDLDNGGKIYQFEFAQFQNTLNGIINFKDTRKFLDYDSLFKEIQKTIESIENGSEFLPKTGGTITGKIKALEGFEGDLTGNASTTTKLKKRVKMYFDGGISNLKELFPSEFDGESDTTIYISEINPDYLSKPVPVTKGGTGLSNLDNKEIDCLKVDNVTGSIKLMYNPLTKICCLNINATTALVDTKIIGNVAGLYRPKDEVWGIFEKGKISINSAGQVKAIPEKEKQASEDELFPDQPSSIFKSIHAQIVWFL